MVALSNLAPCPRVTSARRYLRRPSPTRWHVPWVEASAPSAPDRRLVLSSIRTPGPKSVKSVIVAAGSALALSAVALGPAVTTSAALPAAARPAVHLVSAVTPAAGQAISQPTPRQIARRMLRSFGWRQRQFRYLNRLWNVESSWQVHAQNPWSGAYGIPQAVPGAKMASVGGDWRTSARTQIRWGLRYIQDVYGTPHGAWNHEVADGWY